MKRIAVIALTKRGKALSAQIAASLPAYDVRQFCFYQYADAQEHAFQKLSALTAQIFSEYDALIFLCACGIAVRAIAPHLQSKQTDPAVLAVDERGTYAIPLLSGHIGGANALAKHLAAIIGAEAVITTATDIGGLFSPDSFAAANQLLLTDFHAAKRIAAAVVNGEQIGFRCRYPYKNLPPVLTVSGQPACGIIISDRHEDSPFQTTLRLCPKNIVLGIGCRKGTAAAQIAEAVHNAFSAAGLHPERICKAASIDLKANEAGLLQFCKDRRIPLHTYPADLLMQVQGDFSGSGFVQQITGADNVCERSAVLCSGGHLILRKTAKNGVTAAAAEMPVEIDFEKEMLPCSMSSDSEAAQETV